MTKIVLTCEDYLPSIGGAEICVANLFRELQLMGHEATVYTNTMKTLDDETNIVRVPWRFRPAALWKNITTLWRLIKEHDLVHCQYSFRLACLCAIISRLQRKPMLLTQQGKGIVPEAHTKLRHKWLFQICQWVSMKGATLLTSTSDEITDLTAEFVPREKIVPISNGYDARMFQPNPDLSVPQAYASLSDDTQVLLTVRRLVPKNGIHILVQALALVRREIENFHYFAIGEGRGRQLIEGLVQELDLQNHVTLLGVQSNDLTPSYYQHADIVLVPSSAEATSIACIEAMGMQRPLIASRVGGLIDLLGTNEEFGTLVSIYDSEACTYDPPDRLPEERLQPLAAAIIDCLNNSAPFEQKAAKALSRVQAEFSWEQKTKQYFELYQRLLLQ